VQFPSHCLTAPQLDLFNFLQMFCRTLKNNGLLITEPPDAFSKKYPLFQPGLSVPVTLRSSYWISSSCSFWKSSQFCIPSLWVSGPSPVRSSSLLIRQYAIVLFMLHLPLYCETSSYHKKAPPFRPNVLLYVRVE